MKNNDIKRKHLVKSYSLYNTESIKLNLSDKKHEVKKPKKHLSKKQILNNKFYKLLIHSNSATRKKFCIFPNIIDKNTFNFNLEDENTSILRRTLKIQKGNKKHLQLSKLEYKKKEKKLDSVKLFRQKMKIMQEEAKVDYLKEQKRMKELVKLKKIKTINQLQKHIHNENKEKFENFEQKLNSKREILMKKFHEIIKKYKKTK